MGAEKDGTEEIEVTPEMIEAATDYWTETYGYTDNMWPGSADAAKGFFAGIYRAMAKASSP